MKLFYFLIKLILLAGLIFIKSDKNLLAEGIFSSWGFKTVLLNFVIFILSAHLIEMILSFIYRRSKKIPAKRQDNVLIGLKNIYYILVGGAVFMTAFGLLGIDHKTLFTSLSIVAAAIAIISKDFITEIISGIIISFSHELSLDDYVMIGQHKGKIIDLNMTRVVLLNEDDDVIFINNNKVFASDVVNYTSREIKKVSVEFELDLKYLRTVEELEDDLIECLSDFHDMIESNSFNLKIGEVKRDSLMLKFQYALHKMDRDIERQIRRKTVRQVVDFVKRQRDTIEPGGLP